jgi:hypothetical protein
VIPIRLGAVRKFTVFELVHGGLRGGEGRDFSNIAVGTNVGSLDTRDAINPLNSRAVISKSQLALNLHTH